MQIQSSRPTQSADAASRIVALLQEAAAQISRNPEASRSYLAEASTLLGQLETESSTNASAVHRLVPWQAQRVRSYIEARLDQAIRVEDLAEHTGLSTSYFFRAFRGTFGVSPHAFIMRCRTNRAFSMLRGGDEPIAQVAVACGFADQAHFSRAFTRRAGLPPGAWRRLQRGGLTVEVA